MQLYFIRHGETDFNKNGQLQGQTDIPLNKEGESQALAARKKIGNMKFDAIYSSPLQRAVCTGEIVTKQSGVTFHKDPRLIEISFGDGEGKEFMRQPQSFRNFFDDPDHFEPMNRGEDFQQLLSRAQNFLDNIILHSYDNVCIFSHGGLIHAVLMLVCGYQLKDFWKLKVPNCAICQIEWKDDKFKLIQIDN